MNSRIISICVVGLLVIGGFVGLFLVTDQVSAPGPTYVSGSIASDTTWYLVDNPYIVTGDVTVEPGATLIIEPGVEVKFDGTYSITVDGRLVADGTSISKIKFTSNQISPAKGDWYTIRLRTEDNLIDNTEVEYATYGIFMTFFGGNNTISNTTAKYCKFDGIYITNSDNNTISDCTIISNDRYGITIYESHNTKLNDCIIQYNNFFGINLNASTYTQIYDCNISYNDGKGILFYSNSHNTTISGCEIDWNNFIGIDLSGSSDNDIINTTIIGNNGIGIDFGGRTSNQWIENCDIIDNEGTGINLRGSYYVDIVGCNISKNKGKGGIHSVDSVNHINITNSEIWNNLAGNGIDVYQSEWVNISNSNISKNAGNGISFNGSNVQEYNVINNCTVSENSNNGIYFYSYSSGGNAYIQNNNIYSSIIYSNSQNGIYFYANTNNRIVNFLYSYILNNYIYSNIIYSNNQNGLYFKSQTEDRGESYIQQNNLYLNKIYSNNQNGIYFSSSSYLPPYIQHNNISSNTIYSNNQNGINFDTYVYYQRHNSYIQNNIISSNIIYSNNQNGIYFFTNHRDDDCYLYIQYNNIFTNNIYLNAQNGVYIFGYTDRPSTNSYLQNNNIHSNNIYQHKNGTGIYLQADHPAANNWQPSKLYNNTITSNLIGIRFLRIKSHIIYANDISNNDRDGILLDNSYLNTLRYNTITNNNWTGINLTNSSSYNNIENNNIFFGIRTGIFISGNSDNNVITRNDLMINSEVGLKIIDASGNQIHHNNFKNNVQNAYDSTIALNDWDDGAEGNYWSDYLGTDDDGDGFGEDPYVIPGGGSRDWHPFMIPLNITAPYVIFTSPANGDINVPVDTMISVTFSKEMNTTAVENAISISGGLSPIGFVWDAENEIVTFIPSSNLTSKTIYTVTITTDAKDILGNRMEDTYMFSFTSEDIEPPKISVTSPFDGETNIEINADIVVTFNEPMQRSTVTYSCAPDPDGWGVSWSSDNMIATFSHNDFGSEITYTFQITAGKDTANLNLVAGSVPNPWSFTSADVVGPEIISTFPVDGSQSVSNTANIEINFNEQMNKSSVTYTCAPNPLGWSVTWTNGDRSAIFSHKEFAQKTLYTFHVTSAKDVSGNDLNPSAIPNPWSFTTTGDYIAPQISLTSPANNAVNVDPDANIIVIFSEAINTSTFTYVCIPDPEGWSESWSAGNTVVTLTHKSFDSSKIYVFQITGAKDLANNSLVTGPIPNPWSFQIADIIAPTIILTSPPNGTTTVVQTANVVVTFSEIMNTSSITFTCSPNPTGWSVSWSGGDTVATFMHNPFDSYTTYTFHITSGKDLAGNDLAAGVVPNPWSFTTIDNTAPTIISTLPSDSAINVGLNQNVIVTFTEAMNTSSLTFSCFPDPGGWSASWGSGDTVAIFSHNAFMNSTTYTFHIANAKDVAGNNLVIGAVPNPWSFTTQDFTEPQIIATLPINGSIDISLNANIVVTFSKAMDTSSLNYICIPDPGGWAESWSAGNIVVTFSHKAFANGTTYGFQITSGKDIMGNDLTPGTVPNPWSFTTTRKLVAPQITWTSPANNVANVDPNTNIIVTFSQAIDPSSLNYICTPDPGGWSESWNAGNTVVTFSHNPFAFGTTYTFQITSGKDMAGNNLTLGAVPHSWNFTTISVDSLIVTPSEVNITLNGTVVLIAQAYDLQNNPITDITYIWSVDNNLGSISPQGSQIVTFKASSNVGTCYVNVTAGGKSASAFVTIKSEDLGKEGPEDSRPEDIMWISLLALLIIIACIVILVAVLWKKGEKTEEGPGSVESITSEETADESQEETQEPISEPTPPSPPPP